MYKLYLTDHGEGNTDEWRPWPLLRPDGDILLLSRLGRRREGVVNTTVVTQLDQLLNGLDQSHRRASGLGIRVISVTDVDLAVAHLLVTND